MPSKMPSKTNGDLDNTIGTFKAVGIEITAKRATYVTNGRLGVELLVRGRHWAMLSTNLVDAPELSYDHFYARTWSEMEQFREPALNSGLFEDTGERIRSGFVLAEVWRIKRKEHK